MCLELGVDSLALGTKYHLRKHKLLNLLVLCGFVLCLRLLPVQNMGIATNQLALRNLLWYVTYYCSGFLKDFIFRHIIAKRQQNTPPLDSVRSRFCSVLQPTFSAARISSLRGRSRPFGNRSIVCIVVVPQAGMPTSLE
jgi:hypothetical protein